MKENRKIKGVLVESGIPTKNQNVYNEEVLRKAFTSKGMAFVSMKHSGLSAEKVCDFKAGTGGVGKVRRNSKGVGVVEEFTPTHFTTSPQDIEKPKAGEEQDVRE